MRPPSSTRPFARHPPPTQPSSLPAPKRRRLNIGLNAKSSELSLVPPISQRNTTMITCPQPRHEQHANFNTPFSLADLRTLRTAIVTRGSDDDLLAFRLLQEVVLSPNTGIATNALPALSAALAHVPQAVMHGRAVVPLAALPAVMRSVVSSGVSLLHSPAPLSATTTNTKVSNECCALLNGQNKEKEEKEKEKEAVRLLSDNIHYAFENFSTCTKGAGHVRLWRGATPDSTRVNPRNPNATNDDRVMSDALYDALMRREHRNYGMLTRRGSERE